MGRNKKRGPSFSHFVVFLFLLFLLLFLLPLDEKGAGRALQDATGRTGMALKEASLRHVKLPRPHTVLVPVVGKLIVIDKDGDLGTGRQDEVRSERRVKPIRARRVNGEDNLAAPGRVE